MLGINSSLRRISMKYDISHIIMMGDSLSDRGRINHRLLFGIIPMRWVSGLEGVSPDGRFTNGLAWTDHLAASLANEFIIDKLEINKKYNASDIADAVINRDPKIEKMIHDYFNLKNDLFVKF